MTQFVVLDAADSRQYNHWIALWEMKGIREVFAHPDYLQALKRPCDSALCGVWEGRAGNIMLPFILRPLAVEEWAGNCDGEMDIVSPYGFGGPFVTGTPEMADFWKALAKWAERNGVISGFFRLSPFLRDFDGIVDQVEIKGGNVIRSLSEGREMVWQNYSSSLRHHIRQAERRGIRVEVDENGERIDDFLRIYYGIMERKNALTSYYFPEQFFHTILKKIPGGSKIFHGIYDNVVVGSNMVLMSDDIIYGFLGGSDRNCIRTHAGMYSAELIYHSIINWGIDHNKKYLVLGGGYEGCDGIFNFKKKFAPNGIVPFEVGKHIFDSEAYRNMCELRRKYETEQRRDWVVDGTYFPAYRTKED